MRRSALTVILFAALMGCSDTAVSPRPNIAVNRENANYTTGGQVRVFMEKTGYISGEPIVVFLQNGGSATAFFSQCDGRIGFWIDRKQDSVWTDAGNIAMLCLGLFPSGIRPLDPGRVNSDTFTVNVPGIYRLRFPYSWQSAGRLGESAVSNEYVVQ